MAKNVGFLVHTFLQYETSSSNWILRFNFIPIKLCLPQNKINSNNKAENIK